MILERLHDHIVQELQQNSRSETVFVSMAVALNLITVAVNSGLAAAKDSPAANAVLVVTMALVLVVNWVAYGGLGKGRETKAKLLAGLIKMYEEEGVAKYYDLSLLELYTSRYRFYLVGVIATGVASLIIPVVVLIFK
jgi:hypothetical protein